MRPITVVPAILLALVMAGCGSSADQQLASPSASAIYGGTVAASCDLPAVAQVEARCSGVLITPRLVAYAGHCGLDVHTLSFQAPDGGSAGQSVGTCVSPYSSSADADVAFCILDNPIVGIPIAPVLPSCLEPQDWRGTSVLIAGYGLDGPGGTFGVKRFFSGTIVSYSPSKIAIAIGDGGTCSGDSGGPVYMRAGDSWFVVGVVSRGDAVGCDSSMVYATPLRPWEQWTEDRTHVRVSPCELHGAWDPSHRCGLSVVDDGDADASCLAAQTSPSDIGPCPPSPLPSPDLGLLPITATFTPADGEIVVPTPTVPVSVELGPAGVDASVDLSVTSPTGLSWRAYLEFPPYQIDVPADVQGRWSVRAVVTDAQGAVGVHTGAFTVRAPTRSDGCSIGRGSAGPLGWATLGALLMVAGGRRRQS